MPSPNLTAAQRRLTAARERRRRLALGPPLTVTDADLSVLSTVSAADMPHVEAFVRDAAGETGVALLRAKREG